MGKAHVHTGKWTINEFYEDYYKKNKLIFNTEYQRSEIWPINKKQRLIDSIIKEYHVGMVFLRELDGNYEVLDGQQRLKSIFQYMENHYSTSNELTPEAGDIYFDDLSKDAKRFARFIAFQIDIAFLENADEETTTDIFLRLQEGIPLNTPEKLNAKRGKMRDQILELSKHPFIKNTSIKDTRFAHRLLAAQLFCLEMNSNFDTMNFPDVKSKELTEMYEQYSIKKPPYNIISNMKRNLNFLNKSFKKNASLINRRGDFIPLYLVISYLDKKYVSEDIFTDIVDFLQDFLKKVESMKAHESIQDPELLPYREFKELRSSGALSSRSLIPRFKIMLTKYLEFNPNLKLKDPKRLFDYGQKLAIYQKDKGECKICKVHLNFDEAEFDHILPWSKGGQTTVGNGQLLCATCNKKKGNSM
jgi:hypothetical protein